MDGYDTSIKLFKPGEEGFHFYVDTYEKWGLAVCVNCGKKIDLTTHKIGEPDTKCQETSNIVLRTLV